VLSEWLHTDPVTDLRTLLSTTNPDLVRLPVYWDRTQPSPGSLDFSSIDDLLNVVVEHNKESARPTRVILTIGARNFMYPELYAPSWAGPRQQPELGSAQADQAYRQYFDSIVIRYRTSPLLFAWQVENEPFDYVVNATTGADQISAGQMAWEIGQVHHLDPDHRAVTTSFDGWNVFIDWLQLHATPVVWALHAYPSGHPGDALNAADALGLDIYVDGPTTPLRFTSIALRTSWKAQAIQFWADQARAQNKQVWLMEMQAQPWSASDSSFSTADLLTTAAAYRREPLNVVLLWGAETWLTDPAWMNAAVSALAILRAP